MNGSREGLISPRAAEESLSPDRGDFGATMGKDAFGARPHSPEPQPVWWQEDAFDGEVEILSEVFGKRQAPPPRPGSAAAKDVAARKEYDKYVTKMAMQRHIAMHGLALGAKKKGKTGKRGKKK